MATSHVHDSVQAFWSVWCPMLWETKHAGDELIYLWRMFVG